MWPTCPTCGTRVPHPRSSGPSASRPRAKARAKPAFVLLSGGAGGGSRTPTPSRATGPKPAVAAVTPLPRAVQCAVVTGAGPLRSSGGGELADQFGDVTGGADVVHRRLHLALRVDDDRRADDAHHRLPVHLLLAEGPVGIEHRPLGVRQQRKGQ